MKPLLIAAILFVLPMTASASVQLIDNTNTLNATQKTAIETIPSSHRVVVEFINVNSQNDLGSLMDKCVTTPDTMCIGIDPIHRWTSTRFGIDTGVRQSDFIQVSRAGNLEFKDGNWPGGVQSIISRANVMSYRTDKPTAVVINQPIVKQSTPVWPFLVGFGLLGLTGWLVWRAIRRKQEKAQEAIDDVRREAAELASNNIKNDNWSNALNSSKSAGGSNNEYVPLRRADYYTPPTRSDFKPNVTVVNSGGMSDFGTGLMMGHLMTERPGSYCHGHVTPEPVAHHHQSYRDDSCSSGGNSSSWSSDSSSGGDSSSFDSSSFSSGGGDSSF